MDFVKAIGNLIYDLFRGLYSIVIFVFEIFDYCYKILSVLPEEVVSILISSCVVAFCVIIYKAIKL